MFRQETQSTEKSASLTKVRLLEYTLRSTVPAQSNIKDKEADHGSHLCSDLCHDSSDQMVQVQCCVQW